MRAVLGEGEGGGRVKPLSNSLRVYRRVRGSFPTAPFIFHILFSLSLSRLFSLFFCCMILSLLGLVSDALVVPHPQAAYIISFLYIKWNGVCAFLHKEMRV